MTATPANPLSSQECRQLQGIAVRSHLRAGIVLQVDAPALTTLQQAAQTTATATTTTATTTS